MPDILYSSDPHPGYILLSDEFILQHMPRANGTYVKVFLYAYQHYCNRVSGLSTQSISQALHLIESDVIEALRYWQDLGLVHIQDMNGALSIRFEDGGSLPTPPPVREKMKQQEQAERPVISKVVQVEHKPTYTPEELAVYQTNPKIAGLFAKASVSFGAPLSPPNLSMLYSFYDYYRLPVDVIEYLIEYCLSHGGRTLRYMEKVAQDWSDQGINTLEKAQAYVTRFASYRPILNALHLRSARPSDQELTYIRRWMDEYQMPEELIVEACNRTYSRTNQPSFAYADSILENWHLMNIHSMDGVAKADESFLRSQGVPAERRQNAAGAPEGFSAHSDWDYEALERMAQDQLYSERK